MMRPPLITEVNGEDHIGLAGLIILTLDISANPDKFTEAERSRSKFVLSCILDVAKSYGLVNSEKIFSRGVIDEFAIEEAHKIAGNLGQQGMVEALRKSGMEVN